MKKILFSFILSVGLLISSRSEAQSYEGYLGVLDTLTNVDTTTKEVTVTGPKHVVSFQININKISGTVGGTINVYGSIDGVTYLTTAIASQITTTDATQVRSFVFTNNAYKKYKIVVINANGGVASNRTYVLYRDVR